MNNSSTDDKTVVIDYTMLSPSPQPGRPQAPAEDAPTDDKTVAIDYTVLGPSLDQEREEAPAEGRLTEHYSLRGTVGAGGVGRVLLGFDERIGREIAIKEMLDTVDARDPAVQARFLREVQVTGKLEHPGIVPVYDMGKNANGSPFYVMRFVRGDTLSKALAACEDPQPEKALGKRLQLMERLIDICEAMAYAHSRGVVHRDLKPGNVVLGQFGETIVLDWGLAKVESEPDDSPAKIETAIKTPANTDAELTQDGAVLGTPSYMAPEQLDPRFGRIDPRTDVFALGAILYHILVGRPPLRGNLPTILARLADADPMPSPRQAAVEVPAELAAICEKALAKAQAQRYPDAAALADELKAFRDGRMVSTYAYSRGELLRRFIARNKTAVAAGLIAIVGIVVGAGLAVDFGVKAHHARLVAEAALGDVTRISDADLTLADNIANGIESEFHAVTADMEAAAKSLADPTDRATTTPLLYGLKKKFPLAETYLAIVPPGTVTAIVPANYAKDVGRDVSQLDHVRLAIDKHRPTVSHVYQAREGFAAISVNVPVLHDGKVTALLAAHFEAGRKLAALLPARSQTAQRQIWVVEDDGTLVYDSDPTEIGRNLFRAERFDRIPELRQLADEIKVQDNGIGYYSTTNGGHVVSNRIAAWRTITPAANRHWKIVVLEAWGHTP